jgi:hypothetical protein
VDQRGRQRSEQSSTPLTSIMRSGASDPPANPESLSVEPDRHPPSRQSTVSTGEVVRPASSSSVAGVIPERIRWAIGTLAAKPDDRLLEIGGGSGAAASLVCERLDRGSLLLIDRSPTAIERTRRRNPEHVASGRLELKTIDVASFDPGEGAVRQSLRRQRQRPLDDASRRTHTHEAFVEPSRRNRWQPVQMRQPQTPQRGENRCRGSRQVAA